MSPQEAISYLKDNDELYSFPDISIPRREEALDSYAKVMDNEQKLMRALSHGIRENSNLGPKDNYLTTLHKLADEMEVPRPKLKFDYSKGEGLAAYADIENNVIGINPSNVDPSTREAVLAHELRHLKEKGSYSGIDKSPRGVLFTESSNPLESLYKFGAFPDEVKRMEGRSMSEFIPKEDRLFENDKLKYKSKVLDKYDYMEKGHFKEPFLSKNLRRVAKGLPLIGAAAALLTSDDASAAIDPFDSTQIDVAPEDKFLEDPSSPEFEKYTDQFRGKEEISERDRKRAEKAQRYKKAMEIINNLD